MTNQGLQPTMKKDLKAETGPTPRVIAHLSRSNHQ